MNIIFCNNNADKANKKPFPNPIIVIIEDIVYPKQKPLYNIIPKTIGIPDYCCPKKPQNNCKYYIFNQCCF